MSRNVNFVLVWRVLLGYWGPDYSGENEFYAEEAVIKNVNSHHIFAGFEAQISPDWYGATEVIYAKEIGDKNV